MHIKTHPADLIDGFGIKNEETEELELLFEDYGVYAMVRELAAPASSRFWLFEIGAWNESDPNTITLRSTPFISLGNDVDSAAKQIEIMVTGFGFDPDLKSWTRGRRLKKIGVENGATLTGQRWTEYVQFGELPVTSTKPYQTSVKKIKANGMEN